MPSMQSKIFADWISAVDDSQGDYRSRIGCDFTPSRVNELKTTEQTESDTSCSTDSWRVPCNESIVIRQLVATYSNLSNEDILSRLLAVIKSVTKNPISVFWSSTAEAAIRAFDNPLVLAEKLDEELNSLKLPRKRLCMHRLFSKIFLIKQMIYRECISDQKLVSYLGGLSATDPMIVSLRDTYNKLSKLEFHSTGKSKTGDVMTFMLKELLPFAVRDIPFAILKKLTLLCFDIDLFEDDYSKFWNADINADYAHFRSDSSLHRWNDQYMMKSSAAQIFASGNHDPQDSPQDYGVITLAYEAPWIMPNLQNTQPGTRVNGQRKSGVTAHPTARMVKLEGRRQSYKPAASSTSATHAEDAAGAICIVQGTDDQDWPETTEFSIRRNSLDEIPGDWDFMVHRNDDKKHGISDVLEDLLGSPTRPSTQTTNSPENIKSRKRSLSMSPRKRLGADVSASSPQTVIKKPCKREEVNDENIAPNQKQNLRDLLWNDEPPISERTRKGGTPKDTRIKYNI